MKIENYKTDTCLICFNELANDARTYNLAMTLIKYEKSICIISLSNEFDQNTDDNIFLSGKCKNFKLKLSNDSHTYHRWLQFKNSITLIKSEIKSDVFIAMDLYSLYPAYKLAKRYNSKLIYDSREIYSALGPLYKNNFKQFLISTIEKRLIKYVDEFIVSGQLDADYLSAYFKTNKPFKVIMNLPFYKEPVKSDIIRQRFSIPNDKVILLYQGMILPGRGLLQAVESLEYLEKAVLCILGDGNYQNHLNKIIKEKKLVHKVIFCGKVNYNELHQWTSSADIGICLIEPITLSYNLALPNKLFEYCMARIPAIATDLPAIKNIIEKHQIAKLISPQSSPKVISDSIKELMLPDVRQNLIFQCDNASKEYCYENQELQILSLLK